MSDSWNAYNPERVSRLVERSGVAKAHLPFVEVFTLAALAGAFIALGAAFYLAVIADAQPVTGLVKFAGGIAFSLGLVLVIIAGAELFTGNALMVIALVDRRIRLGRLMRNWTIVYFGNLLGSLALVVLVHSSGLISDNFAETARSVAEGKLRLSTQEAISRGILCNALVCLAVWMSYAARTAGGKVSVIILPIAGFVVLGMEHSVANMFLLPLGILAGAEGGFSAVSANIAFVTLGNVIGGAGGVAVTYWIAYRWAEGSTPTSPSS